MKRYWEIPRQKKNYKKQYGWSQDKFYQSTRWRNKRKAFIIQSPLCLYCKYHGKYKSATVVDHITPRRLGGADLENYNLQSLCTSCHNTKSAHERNKNVDPITQEIYKIKKLGDVVQPECETTKKEIYERLEFETGESNRAGFRDSATTCRLG